MPIVSTITIASLAFAAGFWLARRLYLPRVPTHDAPLRPDIHDAEIQAQLTAGRRIEALRLLRAKHGYGVRAAQRAADAMAAGWRAPR